MSFLDPIDSCEAFLTFNTLFYTQNLFEDASEIIENTLTNVTE